MTHTLENIQHIAIIRGVEPDQAVEVTQAFYDGGFRAIEVPLNSPDPLQSIRRMVDQFADRMLIGAGTVMTAEQARQVADAGGRLIVSPNTNEKVITETQKLGLISLPGVMTPTECFAALDHGADGLKLFPANVLGIDAIKAYRLVLPSQTPIYAVGGIGDQNAAAWLEAGAAGVGVGSCCYKPGMSPAQITTAAKRFFTS